jgi:N-formylmaleamate deformylase
MRKWTSDFVDLAGHRMSYHRTGGDLPVLLLAHGLSDNGLCWTRVARALEPHFDIIMLDAPGHGCSERIDAVAQDDHGADIAAVIHRLGLERPAVLGHSVGATSMALFANRFPELTSKIVLEDPVFMPIASSTDRRSENTNFKNKIMKFGGMTLMDIEAFGAKQILPGMKTK